MAFSREMDCRLAIIRTLIGSWEEGREKNTISFNTLVKIIVLSGLLGEQMYEKSPFAPAVSRRARRQRCRDRQQAGKRNGADLAG
jgi:hypothetical protein